MLYAFAAVIAADRSSNRRCMRAVRKTKEMIVNSSEALEFARIGI